MSHTFTFWRLLCLVLFVVSLGCDDAGNHMPPGGLIVDEPGRSFDENSGQDDETREVEDLDREQPRRSIWDEDDSTADRRDFRDRSDDSRPSRRMPSDTENWGSERKMPSDSMPSRTEKWGSERKMPSDSMPSRTEKWGSERKMPSDSMPSRTRFRSRNSD